MSQRTGERKIEEKRVSNLSIREALFNNRDWLIGGNDFQWRVFRDMKTLEIVMQRY